MEQKDYLMNQIEQLGIVLGKLLLKVLKAPDKEEIEIIEEVQNELEDLTYLNIDELLNTSNDILALKIQAHYNLNDELKQDLKKVISILSLKYSKLGRKAEAEKLEALANMI